MIMRKALLSILLFMLCMTCAVANPVTQDQALQKAKAFLVKKGLAVNANISLVYQGKQRAHHNGAPSKDACYYVFNNGQNAGFVIISGDDCAEDVLGYADSGSFDADNIPSNMQVFLQGYAEEIAAARALGLTNTGDEVNVEVARKVVPPLIETKWNQSDPYNQKCANPQGQRCVTGCVATALAQVMYYHKWPNSSTSTSTIPGYTLDDWRTHAGDTYAQLDPTKFDWAKMKNAYVNTGADDEDAETAVANLMLYCGHAVKMDYGVSESGGLESEIPNALINYFNYPGNPTWQKREKYSPEVWDEMIYNELKNGRPVLYGASTTGGGLDTSGGGHEFICDGYDGHGLYHINWGWGGSSDGYYRLTALRPTSQGVGGSGDSGGYSIGHDAIIGVSSTAITGEQSSSSAESALLTEEMYVDGENVVDYNSRYGFHNVMVYFQYSLAGMLNGIDRGFGLYKDGELLQYIQEEENVELLNGYYYYTTGSLYGLGTNLEDGNYQVMGINKLHGTEEWLPNVGSNLIYLDVEISNGKATFTNVKKTETFALEVTGLEQRFENGFTDKNNNRFIQIRAYLRNTGDAVYDGRVFIRSIQIGQACEGVHLSVGGEDYVDFFIPTSNPNNSFSATITLRDESGNQIYSQQMRISNVYPDYSITKKGYHIYNYSDGKMYSALLDGDFTLQNDSEKPYEGVYSLEILRYSGTSSNGTSYSVFRLPVLVKLLGNEKKTIPFAFSGLAVGDKFLVSLTDPSGNAVISRTSTIEIVPGVVYWRANGTRYAEAPTSKIVVPKNITAVSFEDLALSNYTIDFSNVNNNNIIFYVGANDAAGYTKITNANAQYNVVKDYQATKLMLSENYDFFVPKRFYASEVHYTYTPTLAANGVNGWQSISLPFPVKKVTSDNKQVDWFHGNDTEEKDFWVREFKQVVGSTVKFADAATWEANVPYIFAVPGNKWGPEYNMVGKEMDFSATDVWVEKSTVKAVVSDRYEFVGITGGTTQGAYGYSNLSSVLENAYVLNEKGNAFEQGSTTWQNKHNVCYFTIDDLTIGQPAKLNIGFFEETDGICLPQVKAEDGQLVDVYNVDGMKVATVVVNGGKADLSGLPKGVFIVEGKKIVR